MADSSFNDSNKERKNIDYAIMEEKGLPSMTAEGGPLHFLPFTPGTAK